MYQQTTE